MLREAAPGVWDWDTKDMQAFRAFAVVRDGEIALIDPVKIDAAEQEQLQSLGTVKAVLITGRWHERDAAQMGKRFNVPVYAHPDALASFDSKDIQPFPRMLPLGIEALMGTGASQGDVVYYLPWDGGTLIAGDFFHNIDMKAVPLPVRMILKYGIKLRDGLHLFPPVKAENPTRMLESARSMLGRSFDRLLVSHGDHILTGAHARLEERLELGV